MRLVAISLEHGNAPTSAWGYVGFGILLLDTPEQAATSTAFGKVGIELARRLRDPTTESWVLTTFAVQSEPLAGARCGRTCRCCDGRCSRRWTAGSSRSPASRWRP